MSGRPLRFLAATLGGWTTLRVALLWHAAVIPAAAGPAPQIAAEPVIGAGRWLAAPMAHEAIAPWPPGHASSPPDRSFARPEQAAAQFRRSVGTSVSVGTAMAVHHDEAAAPRPLLPADGVIPPPLGAFSIARGRSRLAGSAWGIVRGGSNGTLLGGQLGASQAGVRLTYALGPDTAGARRVALSVRLATPLRGRGKEAALGIDWQPTYLPLHLIAEQRVSLDGQRGGPTLLLVGGVNPTPVLAGFRLEGYGQAGAIKRDGVEAFGDGATRLTHRLATIGPVRVDLGGGAWGAAQRGARRLDVGPTIGAVLPVAGQALRLTLDWRERVAGNARPGSGPALSIGADF